MPKETIFKLFKASGLWYWQIHHCGNALVAGLVGHSTWQEASKDFDDHAERFVKVLPKINADKVVGHNVIMLRADK